MCDCPGPSPLQATWQKPIKAEPSPTILPWNWSTPARLHNSPAPSALFSLCLPGNESSGNYKRTNKHFYISPFIFSPESICTIFFLRPIKPHPPGTTLITLFSYSHIAEMPRSLDSSRPILVAVSHSAIPTFNCILMCVPVQHTNRDSTYSSMTTISICSADDLQFAEIESQLKRLEDSRLQKQRFVPSEKKSETISKLALGAKLDRALRRRMSGQDAMPRRATITVPSKAQ